MISKLKSNKGFSLLEVLVSVTLIGIMIIPITNMVTTSIKTNKKSETKQYATLLGQEILEQLDLLEDGAKYQDNIKQSLITFPSGDLLKGNNLGYDNLYYSLEKKVEGNTYLIEVALDKNESIDYNYVEIDDENQDNSQISPEIVLDFKKTSLDLNDPIQVVYNSKTYNIKPIIDSNNIAKIELKVMKDEDNSIKSIQLNETEIDIQGSNFNNKLMLNLTKECRFKSENGLNIDVYNNINSKLELYIKRSYKCDERVYTTNKQGALKVINNLRDEEEMKTNKIHNFYNIQVKVSKDGNELFKSYANRNLKINSASS